MTSSTLYDPLAIERIMNQDMPTFTVDEVDPIIQKLNDQLNFDEKELFIKQFYEYMKYDEEKDFCVDLDDTWEWLGYSKKEHASRKFYKLNFQENVEYKISTPVGVEKNKNGNLATPVGVASCGIKHGNSKKILMTLRTFKKFCLKSCTKKADDVHDYFLTMERIINQLVKESRYVCFSKDQFNNSKKLLNHFGDGTDVAYTLIFEYKGKIYMKIGMVHIGTFCDRHEKHVKAFGEGNIRNICVYSAIRCKDVAKVESEFKKTHFYNVNKTNITVNGRNFTEIIELTDNVTAEMIKERINKVAGDRILDPLPHNQVNDNILAIEQEKTKQIEYSQELEILKEKNVLEVKKMEFELEKHKIENDNKKMEFEMKKLEFETKKIELEMLKIKSQKEQPKEQKDVIKNDKIFIWCKNNIQQKEGEIIKLSELYKRYSQENGELDKKSKSELKQQVEKYLGAPVKSSSHHGATYQGWKNVTFLRL